MEIKTPTKYDRVIRNIEWAVGQLNKVMGYSTEFDADFRRNCVTFGYIGNLERWGDDRSWMIFLPHPGRPGTSDDHIGGFSTGDLEGAIAAMNGVYGALRLAHHLKGGR